MGLSVVQAALKLSTLVLAPECWDYRGATMCLALILAPEYLCAAFIEILVVYNRVDYVAAMDFY